MLDFLEEHNFDPSDVNSTGGEKMSCWGLVSSYQRPLHKAVRDKNVEIVLLLVQYGADPMAKDSKGRTAYDYVTSSPLRNRMKTFHVQSRANGAFPLN